MRIKNTNYIIFFILFYSINLYSQDSFDSCNCEVDRILSTFRRLEKNYIENARDKLRYFIKHDSVLKENFLNDNINHLKNLQCRIEPILKIDSKAININQDENICKYFVFDTVNYDCHVWFLLNNKPIFSLRPIPDECDCTALYPGGLNLTEYEKKMSLFFFQSFYKMKDEKVVYNYDWNFISDTNSISNYYAEKMGFYVYGLSEEDEFVIDNKKIHIFSPYSIELKKLKEQPNNFIKTKYNFDWIKYCARKCSVGGVPWWRFWDWDIFVEKPQCWK